MRINIFSQISLAPVDGMILRAKPLRPSIVTGSAGSAECDGGCGYDSSHYGKTSAGDAGGSGTTMSSPHTMRR